MEELIEGTPAEDNDVDPEISALKAKLQAKAETLEETKEQPEVTPGRQKTPRGQNRKTLELWYDQPGKWKHCLVEGCEAKHNSRFLGPFKSHKTKCHKKIKMHFED